MPCPIAAGTDFAAFAADPGAPEWDALREHYPTCVECAASVGALAAVRALLRDGAEGAGSAHPDETTLDRYARSPEALGASERMAVEGHLAGCAPCRSELRVLARFDLAALAATRGEAARADGDAGRRGLAAWLAGLGERLFGSPRPALALAALALLAALPAALVAWWLSAGSEVPGAPVAPPVRVAEELPSAPPAPHDPRELEPLSQEPELAPLELPGLEIAGVEAPGAAARVAAGDDATSERAGSPAPSPAAPPAPEASAAAPSRPIRIAARVPAEPPLYAPRRALAGGSFDPARRTTAIRAGAEPLPTLRALAPEHVAATTSAQPTLYWHLDAPSDVPVELTLLADDAVEPLLELRLAPPVAAGLHALDLAEHGVRLPPRVRVDWFAALVPDQAHRDLDTISQVGLRWVAPSQEVRARLDAAPPARRAHVLAAEGYWLDAFATLSDWIAREPDAETLRAHREALLDQVELAGVDGGSG